MRSRQVRQFKSSLLAFSTSTIFRGAFYSFQNRECLSQEPRLNSRIVFLLQIFDCKCPGNDRLIRVSDLRAASSDNLLTATPPLCSSGVEVGFRVGCVRLEMTRGGPGNWGPIAALVVKVLKQGTEPLPGNSSHHIAQERCASCVCELLSKSSVRSFSTFTTLIKRSRAVHSRWPPTRMKPRQT